VSNTLTLLAAVFGVGGGGTVLAGLIKDWLSKRQPKGSLPTPAELAAGRSLTQLEKDNERLRKERGEQDARHAAERAEWEQREDALLERDRLRRDELARMEARLRELLDEVVALKLRVAL